MIIDEEPEKGNERSNRLTRQAVGWSVDGRPELKARLLIISSIMQGNNNSYPIISLV